MDKPGTLKIVDYHSASAWPFQEARKLLKRAQDKKFIRFETGYGPSGLPHIGTFGEVVRTAMIQNAFSYLSDCPSELICFSDDKDGLRKVPENIPHPERLEPFLNFPLTAVPDPFDEFSSFGEQNNHRLCKFLNNLGFKYTFMSATEVYAQGAFDEALLQVLAHHRKILDLILPTLRPERRATYSPFLPISPSSGRVLQVPMEEYRETTVVFRDEDGKLVELPVTGGQCKLQWKVDWGMRWKALGIDYEMAGKDLIDSVRLASGVCKILGATPPEGIICEHFLDEEGRKISKSKGNGLSIEEWLRYAPKESLSLYMYNTPQRAKRLYFDVIPRHVDDYLSHLESYAHQDPKDQLSNPVWHIHHSHPPKSVFGLSFSLLLNLTSVSQGHDKKMVWGFVTRHDPTLSPETHPFLDELIGHAVQYYKDFVVPTKKFRSPSNIERQALMTFKERLLNAPSDGPSIQAVAYEVGKIFFSDLKEWFKAFYEILLGQPTGPRVGSFISIYGIPETMALIETQLSQSASAHEER